ncbi:hypothetical protein QP178_19670 [Sphingomonas aurantiaca]|jgi:hypothetical protein|uniref:hypothetical protein n=1 Tax=Sphingomonas TaxID=13687 RepID=UPI0006F2A683|nr:MULTISPECIES: hypothetical protein [unclassified Sphingomonas]KQN06701.1 hypothetical protein ASE79_19480 [Sphingomonas sp. Leaf28]RZL29335.1 MAG: hypothetical protein EOP64_01350 [Sphingomonas sp.]TCP65269.1 hypothetical protein C8J43_11310 [Sphingomonas sp. PP-CE-1G-424]
MAKKPSALAGIFDEEVEELAPNPALAPQSAPEPQRAAAPRRSRRSADTPASPAPERRSSHPGKKPVLIHIPEDMHRALRQLSVEEGGEPLTVITERLLRQYLVKRGHTRFAP